MVCRLSLKCFMILSQVVLSVSPGRKRVRKFQVSRKDLGGKQKIDEAKKKASSQARFTCSRHFKNSHKFSEVPRGEFSWEEFPCHWSQEIFYVNIYKQFILANFQANCLNADKITSHRCPIRLQIHHSHFPWSYSASVLKRLERIHRKILEVTWSIDSSRITWIIHLKNIASTTHKVAQ